MGAITNPQNPGNFYAWAETQPKNNYFWTNYQYCENGDEQQLTKYCFYSAFHGYTDFADNLTTLEPIDDAATVNLGNGARTPTKAEWEELKNNTTYEWNATYQYGKFTGSNGNFIILPAVGYRTEYAQFGDPNGFYWTATLCDWIPSKADVFFIGSQADSIQSMDRYRGCLIRPVMSNKK